MLRTDMNTVDSFMRGSTVNALASKLRGNIQFDSADLDANVADGKLIGAVRSLRVYRKASLDNGIVQYYDAAGNLLATNA